MRVFQLAQENAERSRRFALAQQEAERDEAQRQFARDRQAELDARAAEQYEYQKSLRPIAEQTARINLDAAQAKLDAANKSAEAQQQYTNFVQRNYDPLAEGLGKVRAGYSFSKLTPEEQEAVTMHFGNFGLPDNGGVTEVNDDTIRRFALDQTRSGKYDQYQKYRNMEFRSPNGDMSALYGGGKSGKSGSSGKTKTNAVIDDYNLSALYTPAWNKRFGGKKTDYDRKETFRAANAIYQASKDTDNPLTHEQALGLALGDSMFNVRGKQVLSDDLKSLYGNQFTNLDPENQQKLIEHTRNFTLAYAALQKNKENGKLNDAQYLKELQRLDQTWDFKGFTSPVHNEVIGLEYADLMAQLKAAEEYMAKTHPRRYKWVKDNPNVAHDGLKIDDYLAPTREERGKVSYIETGNGRTYVPIYEATADYADFKKHLFEIDAIRQKLLDRERWSEQSRQHYNSGKK
jgi:hypothetical protein